MNQIPTLILGIGGIGSQIAASISDCLTDEDKNYVSIIGIDTNLNDITQLREKHPDMEFIQTSEMGEACNYIKENKECEKWFPNNEYLRRHPMTSGAGQVRALSRLVFESCAKNLKLDSISKELTRIQKVGSNGLSGSLSVIIVGSITGGTGAGIFIQMPLFIRELLKTKQGITACSIKGIVVGSDVTEDVNDSSIKKDAVCVNSYACLKELNSFYLTAGGIIPQNLKLAHYDSNNLSAFNIPYDYLYLVEKSSLLGTVGEARLSQIINYIGKAAYTMLFTPVGPNALSVEDNHVMQLIGSNGMCRFASLGMCRLYYPIDEARDYVALTTVRDLVSREWLFIDNKYEAVKKAALKQQKKNRNIVIPTLEETYVTVFEEETTGASAHLAHFAKDAFIDKTVSAVKDMSNDNSAKTGSAVNSGAASLEYESKAELFVSQIDTKIDALCSDKKSEVYIKRENCKLHGNIRNISDANTQIVRAWNALGDYARLAKLVVQTKSKEFAESIFPTSEDNMQFQKDNEDCVYSLLANAHPVAARYLIYSSIIQLREIVEEYQDKVSDADLYKYLKVDFDSKKEGIQQPIEAMQDLNEKVNRIPLFRELGMLGEQLSGETSGVKELTKKMNDLISKHKNRVNTYIQSMLKYETAKLLLERMQDLAKDYEIFFSVIKTKIKDNDEKIDHYENLEFSFGEDGVYCSKAAFRKMAEDYRNLYAGEMSVNAKQAIFDHIYHVLSDTYDKESNSLTAEQKAMMAQNARMRLERVFENAIIESISAEVITNGTDIVNLTVYDALRKEFELKTALNKNDAQYDSGVENYIKDRVTQMLKTAYPMLAVSGRYVKSCINYLAMSPKCARLNAKGKTDQGLTENYYVDSFKANNITSGNVNVIIDEEFDDTELICIEMNYGYTIENLTKYQDGSRNALAYKSRISRLGMDGDDVSVVTPHLNRYWHEEGFLPAIQSETREKDKADTRRAFIYALGMNMVKMIYDDENADIDGNPRPTWEAYGSRIYSCGDLIGNDYHDFYKSIPFNGVLKLSVLKDAEDLMSMMKASDFPENIYNNILENVFVKDLIHPSPSNKNAKDENIFDVFQSMYLFLDKDEWDKLVDSLLLVLWEFCGALFVNNKKMVNSATRLILKNIYENSSLYKKLQADPDANLTNVERGLIEHYETLSKSQYK